MDPATIGNRVKKMLIGSTKWLDREMRYSVERAEIMFDRAKGCTDKLLLTPSRKKRGQAGDK